MVDNVTIHKREYPKPDPAAMLAAQFPGSINPTVMRIPGPKYLSNLPASELTGRTLYFFNMRNLLFI